MASARELLVAHGLDALTVSAVARRANVEVSIVSRYWPSREALALDALREEWAALASRVHQGAVRVGL